MPTQRKNLCTSVKSVSHSNGESHPADTESTTLEAQTAMETLNSKLSTINSDQRYLAFSRYLRNSPSVDSIRIVPSSKVVR